MTFSCVLLKLLLGRGRWYVLLIFMEWLLPTSLLSRLPMWYHWMGAKKKRCIHLAFACQCELIPAPNVCWEGILQPFEVTIIIFFFFFKDVQIVVFKYWWTYQVHIAGMREKGFKSPRFISHLEEGSLYAPSSRCIYIHVQRQTQTHTHTHTHTSVGWIFTEEDCE